MSVLFICYYPDVYEGSLMRWTMMLYRNLPICQESIELSPVSLRAVFPLDASSHRWLQEAAACHVFHLTHAASPAASSPHLAVGGSTELCAITARPVKLRLKTSQQEALRLRPWQGPFASVFFIIEMPGRWMSPGTPFSTYRLYCSCSESVEESAVIYTTPVIRFPLLLSNLGWKLGPKVREMLSVSWSE